MLSKYMYDRVNLSLAVGFVVMTLVATVFGYLYFQESALTLQQGRDMESKVIQLASTEMKLDSIEVQLDKRIAQVRKLGGDVAELEKAKIRLEEDRASLREGAQFMATRIKQYEIFLTAKDSTIALLSGENKVLFRQKAQLTAVNTSLLEQKELLSDSLTDIRSRTAELETKVNQASSLRADRVKVYAVSAKGREREGNEMKAKRVDNIRIEFTLDKNPLTRQETKRIYLKILDPQGATLADASLGSGVFYHSGQEETYTLSKDVGYTNNNQTVSMLYKHTRDFQPGTYTLGLYAEGQKIGEGTFSVK